MLLSSRCYNLADLDASLRKLSNYAIRHQAIKTASAAASCLGCHTAVSADDKMSHTAAHGLPCLGQIHLHDLAFSCQICFGRRLDPDPSTWMDGGTWEGTMCDLLWDDEGEMYRCSPRPAVWFPPAKKTGRPSMDSLLSLKRCNIHLH